jgi:hypothetical protein
MSFPSSSERVILRLSAKITDRQPEIVEFAKGLKKDGYEKVSILGYCWGTSLI